MKALGQVADDQGSALHNLDASSKQLDDLLRPARPVRRRLAAGLQVAGQRVEDRRSRRQGGAAGHRPARRLRAGTPELGKNLVDRPAAPRRPQVRRREGPAQPRRPGLHRPRGAAAVRLRPDDLDVDLRPEQPHPQDRRLRRAVRRLRQRGDAQEEPGPRAPVRLAPGPDPAGPQLPRRHQARGAGRQRRGRRSAPTATTPAAARRPGAVDTPAPRCPPPPPPLDPVAAQRPHPVDPDGADADRPRRAARRPAAAARRRRHRQQRSRRRPAAAAAAQARREDQQRPAGQTKLLDYLLKP